MAQDAFLAAYLIVGADELKREYVLKRLHERMRKLGDLDFNKDTFSGSSLDADTLIGACNTLPFMSEKRLVLVKEAEKIKKTVQEALVKYLSAPCETTVLVLVAEKLAKNTRLYKAVLRTGKKAIVDCSPRDARELPKQVRQFAASRGVSITQRAAEELIALIGDSTVHLDGEIGKMAVALGRGAVIDVPEVNTYVARITEPKPWHVSDALAGRDAKKVAGLLARMDKQSPFGLLTMCVNRIRDLLVAKEMQGGSVSALASALGRPEWQVRGYFRLSDGFSQRELEQALVSAAKCDQDMKSGADQLVAFERWALGVCSGADIRSV